MKYVYINNDRIVHEVIPAFVDEFPGIPVTQRYSAEFLSHCLEVNDAVEVEQGMEFLPLENRFVSPVRYTGQTGATIESDTVSIAVSFSVPGTWTATADDPDAVLEITDTGVTVDRACSIFIAFTDSEYGRTLQQEIRVANAESIEPQPEPTPEPVPQTLDDQLTAAIEKGLSL